MMQRKHFCRLCSAMDSALPDIRQKATASWFCGQYQQSHSTPQTKPCLGWQPERGLGPGPRAGPPAGDSVNCCSVFVAFPSGMSVYIIKENMMPGMTT